MGPERGAPAAGGGGEELLLHASCVALDGRGLLILGASGSGKSSLALALMAGGAQLVADDRVRLQRRGGALVAAAPARLRGMIEARGLGLLRAEPAPPAALVAAVDLDRAAARRLPAPERIAFLGAEIPLIRRIGAAHFAPALLQYLRAGLWQER